MTVAIHDSGWTRATGLSTTNWNYFVMVESVKEALRSDGTPFVVVGDTGIKNGLLLAGSAPRFPILISLAAEAIADEEIAPLISYVANGGYILAGSSSFTRSNNGAFRPDFALASQMGLSCSPSTNNWLDNTNFIKQSGHRLVTDMPPGELVWRMPTSSEEVSWGTCAEHSDGGGYDGPHQIWQVSASGTNVLARGENGNPYLVVTPYGGGQFIYHAALQPLVGHGGHAPSMYAYLIFRRAIEWAFERAQRPLAKLSPWPYDYDATFIVRHDLENIVERITNINVSAWYEQQRGARGDYYFCTGAITNLSDFDAVKVGLQTAVSDYGATIGPHNGGLPNLVPACAVDSSAYVYWHWGPDEVLDLLPGSDYACNSMSISWAQMDSWVGTNQTRLWVAPYFNATREGSYKIEEQLGVKITGDQKLTPFPHWTLSTQTDGKRYAFLSEPTSEWFVNRTVAQSLEAWPPPDIHSFVTMHSAVDFYYGLGALVNLYSHTLATGLGEAGYLTPDYILYCANTNIHPRMWSANASSVYQWWLERSAAQVIAAYTNSGGECVTTIAIAGPHTNTAVEVLVPGRASFHGLVVHTNSGMAGTNDYRVSSGVIKVRAAAATTTVQVQYVPDPTANDDTYVLQADYPSIQAPGVLANDFSPSGSALTAVLLTNTPGVTLSNNGGFSCSSTGRYTVTYQAQDAQSNYSPPATVNVLVAATNGWYDDFMRAPTNASPLAPWVDVMGPPGGWTVANGLLMGAANWNTYAIAYNTNASWTNYLVEARIKFEPGAFGGGIGGRVAFDPATTNWVRYAAWVYPEGSPGGSLLLRLVKFTGWTSWSGTPLAWANLSAVGTNWHTIKLSFNANQIDVYFDDPVTPNISYSDSDSPYLSGAVSLELYNWPPYYGGGPSYNMSVDDVIVTPLQ